MPTVLDFHLAQAGIRAAVEGQLAAAIEALSREISDPTALRDAVTVLTQTTVREYGLASGSFAADWYNDLRFIENVTGSFSAIPAVREFDEKVEAVVRRSVATMFTDEPDVAEFVEAVTSKAGQYTVDGARNTVRESSLRDPQSSGWKRVPHGVTCDFCLMLVGRGGVYKRSTAVFKSHGGCDCGAMPSWDLSAPEVPTIAYTASTSSNSTAAVQAWIEANKSELDLLRAELGL